MRMLLLLLSLFLSSALAQPVGYPTTACAVENATCKIAAPGNLVFGDAKTGKFDAPLHVSADTPCTLATFGKLDPIYGTVKACFFLADPVVAIPVFQVTPPFFPASGVTYAIPPGAAMMSWPAASAPGCTGPATGRSFKSPDGKFQIWTGGCQKKGYVFSFTQVEPTLPTGQITLQQPTGFPVEQAQ